ncbi:MAG: hypothetical protein M1822_008887 [Bathelium mastoideum]|nr:MAG: hypothetical protein M1822_008887 [Bathelium mastoideum]
MRISRCGIHGFHEVLGIDVEEIRLYWVIEADEEGAVQTAYHVKLSTDAESVQSDKDNGENLTWDSGRINSDSQRDVLCKPDAGFLSTCNYYWTVTVWDQSGTASRSETNRFFTAYPRSQQLPPWSMNQTYMPHTALIFREWFRDPENRWRAVWLGDGGDKPIYLRKSFQLDRRPSSAIVFASGLGHFTLNVNGRPASSHVLDPGWTNYHRTVQFVAYDIKDLLSSGENVLGSHVGNGFYAGDQGDRFFWPTYEDNTFVRYGNELCFFAELHLSYEDGSRETLTTDPSWKVRKSATTLANIYASEDHDRRQYPEGWDTPGFDDSSWQGAKPLTGPRGKLRYQSQPPVVLHETFQPVKTHSPRDGTVCFDLAQNASTMIKIVVEGELGSKVTIRYGESIYPDGTVLMPDPLFKQFETGVYSTFTLGSVNGPQEWQPDFSFTAARYVQVDGVSLASGKGLPVLHSVVGQHVSSAARKLGSLRTDKEDANAVIKTCYWSFVSNLFSYHTDCPQIEKFGWLEVTHLLAPASQYIRDMEALYSKILQDILDTQEPDGLVPTMAPEIRYMCGPLHDTITWGCALCFLPEILLRYYGSSRMIPTIYPACKKYMAYMRGKERLGGLIMHGLGDWGRGIAHGNNQANIETAIYHQCLLNCATFARILKLENEALEWDAEAQRIYRAYNENLLVTDKKEYSYAHYTSLDDYSKHDRDAIAQAVALQFNMVPSQHRSDILTAFLADVSDGKIRSGEIGLRYLWNTLDTARRPDLVLQMIRQEEHPSYMRFIRRGETTLPEFWQDECRSKSHDMLGTIYEWFYACILGVKPVGRAYRTWTLRPPYESEFGAVEGSVECPYGEIKVAYKNDEERGIRVEFTVPFGTTAKFELPEAGWKGLLEYGSGRKIDMETGREDVELRHGSYTYSRGP